MKRLQGFYEKRGEKGISVMLYLVFFVLHAVIGLFMSAMTLPEEYAGAAASAVFLGRDWSDIMPVVPSLGGFLGGIIYVPCMLLCPEPSLQYKLFLCVNSAIYAIIPTLAFRLSAKAGVEKLSYRILISAVCGSCSYIFTNSHHLFTGSLAAVCVWIVMGILMREHVENNGKKRAGTFFASVMCAVISICAYFLDSAYIALFGAVCVFGALAKKLLCRRPVFLSVYAVVYMVIFSADFLLTFFADEAGLYEFGDGIYSKVINAVGAFSENPLAVLSMLGGRVYYFATSSWGIGVASAALCAYAAVSYFRRKKRGHTQTFDERHIACGGFFLIFAVFIFLTDSFLSLNAYGSSQQAVLSYVPALAVITPAIFLFFVHILKYGMDYLRLMSTIASVGIFQLTALVACGKAVIGTNVIDPVLTAELSPLRVGTNLSVPFNGDTLMYPVCLMFAAFAVLVPVVCCTGIRRTKIMAFVCTVILSFSTVYCCAAAIFPDAQRTAEETATVYEISDVINSYDDGDQTVIAVYGADRQLAMSMQYFNQNSKVIYAEELNELPDGCFAVSDRLIGGNKPCLLIGRTDGINVYVWGEGRQTDTAVPDGISEHTS